jgi:hypothetical protein
MKRDILLAQLKAFQTYLKNHIEDLKARPAVELDTNGELPVDEHNTNSNEKNHIDRRYRKLREAVESEYLEIFYNNLKTGFSDGIRGFQFMFREIEFVVDTITNLNFATSNEPNNSLNSKQNNQPFTKDEVQIINKQLDDLQDKLIEIINKEEISQEKSILIESVKSEINDLKTEVTNPNLGRKDWKNHLINTMITLTFTLSFSQEARTTIFTYFHSLFVFLQQHIFLLKP